MSLLLDIPEGESIYFWTKNATLYQECSKESELNQINNELIGCFAIDTKFLGDEYRYGVFEFIHTGAIEWRHTPFEDFPAEFKTCLLLLGVTA